MAQRVNDYYFWAVEDPHSLHEEKSHGVFKSKLIYLQAHNICYKASLFSAGVHMMQYKTQSMSSFSHMHTLVYYIIVVNLYQSWRLTAEQFFDFGRWCKLVGKMKHLVENPRVPHIHKYNFYAIIKYVGFLKYHIVNNHCLMIR